MEYEILVEKNSNGRVIVDFYGIDFDITDEFVNGKCHKVIFGDQIVFVLKGTETKEEPVENSEEPAVVPEEEHTPVETEEAEEADKKRGKKAKEETAEEN